jgi:hypothetical protein
VIVLAIAAALFIRMGIKKAEKRRGKMNPA